MPQKQETSAQQNETTPKRVGPIIVGLVIVIFLIIAALYSFGLHLKQSVLSIPTTSESTSTSLSIGTSSSSFTSNIKVITNTADDPQSLQNDLNASTNGVDRQNF